MSFNMLLFLKDNNIQFTETGKNCSPDFYQSKCIFCDDHSNHLGWHKTDGYVSCWHCKRHSLEEVCQKLNLRLKDLNKYYTRSLIIEKLNKKKEVIDNIILPGIELQKMHKNYLLKRDFDPDYLEKKYKLQGTGIIGDLCYRIIIPVYYNNKLLSFQGRDITGKSKMRYYSYDKGTNIKNLVYNLDNCKRDFIIITEGVFKVFRLGDNSCATFGVNYTNDQIYLLKKYKKIYIYYDPDIAGQNAANNLAIVFDGLDIETYNLVMDKPADNLTSREVSLLFKDLKIR